jgi:hypothetical protein
MSPSKEVLLGDLFEGIEDEDVALPQDCQESVDHAATERGFSRLKKANTSGIVETPPVVAETSRKETNDEVAQVGDESEQNDDDDGESQQGDEGYWDEEDEIEEHMKRGGVRILDDEHTHGGSEENSDDDDDVGDLALIAGDGTTRGDMNAETQRLLREVATKDRLGKGHKVQIKALSGIVDKLKKKKQEVFGKAVQLRAPEAPKFDDIMSIAFEGKNTQEEEPETVEKDVSGTVQGAAQTSERVTKPGTIQSFFSTPKKVKGTTADDDGSDLEVVSSDDEENDEKLIEVPRLTPTKPSPLAFDLQYGNQEELEDFEDEAKRLFDDGADSESDSESDHSWAVHEDEEDKEAEEGSGQGEVCHTSSEKNDVPSGSADAETDGVTTFSRMKDAMKTARDQEKASKKARTAKKSNFIDEEAELSDEEGMGIAVSDDEDDDRADLDQHGELCDLIDTDDKHHKNDATEELHIKWSRQQDAQQLKDILRGLENGFGRRRGGPLDDEMGEMTGRQRRVRNGDDDDEYINLDMSWPSLFGMKNTSTEGGDGEECEDEAMLMKAAQRKLVESQSDKAFGSCIPLDEDSQHVLELFSTSGSDPVHPPDGLKRLRSRDRSASGGGSDPAGSSLSFIGRKSKVHRQQSTSNMGVHGNNKSFVFERKESSQTEDVPTNNSQSVCAAPIDFSNLSQLTSQGDTTTRKVEKKASRLLKALPRWNKPSNYKKRDSAHVIGAVCNQVAQKK